LVGTGALAGALGGGVAVAGAEVSLGAAGPVSWEHAAIPPLKIKKTTIDAPVRPPTPPFCRAALAGQA
jgi:hypothetical protein